MRLFQNCSFRLFHVSSSRRDTAKPAACSISFVFFSVCKYRTVAANTNPEGAPRCCPRTESRQLSATSTNAIREDFTVTLWDGRKVTIFRAAAAGHPSLSGGASTTKVMRLADILSASEGSLGSFKGLQRVLCNCRNSGQRYWLAPAAHYSHYNWARPQQYADIPCITGYARSRRPMSAVIAHCPSTGPQRRFKVALFGASHRSRGSADREISTFRKSITISIL
jgi:hypothetical protein